MARRLSELRKSVDYLAQSAIADFMDEVHDLMASGRITQGEVADRTGWKPSYVSRILRGETNLTLKTMARLAAALGTSVRVHLAPEGVLVEWVEKTPEEIASESRRVDENEIADRFDRMLERTGQRNQQAPDSRSQAGHPDAGPSAGVLRSS